MRSRGGYIFAVMAAFVGIAAAGPAAQAYDYPYCLQGRSTGIPGDCSYQSYGQCQASASGRSATCNINPRVAFQRQWRNDRFEQPGPQREFRRNAPSRYTDRYDVDRF